MRKKYRQRICTTFGKLFFFAKYCDLFKCQFRTEMIVSVKIGQWVRGRIPGTTFFCYTLPIWVVARGSEKLHLINLNCNWICTRHHCVFKYNKQIQRLLRHYTEYPNQRKLLKRLFQILPFSMLPIPVSDIVKSWIYITRNHLQDSLRKFIWNLY